MKRRLYPEMVAHAIRLGFNTRRRLAMVFDVHPEFMSHMLKWMRRMGEIVFVDGKWRVTQ